MTADATTGRLSTGAGALARLCSAPWDVFAATLWGQAPWLSRADDLPGRPGEVFALAAVDELLSERGLRTPFLRLAKDGTIVPPARYTGSGGIGAAVGDQVLDDGVLRLLADGTTVVLQGLHRTWPAVRALAADLAADLGHPVQVNAYLTPPQSRGFAAHYDTHDVFVLQEAGRKRWRVYPPVRPVPLPEEPWEDVADAVREAAGADPLLDVELAAGDCLYLPRGFLHAAQALGGTSLHLTFGVHPVRERDVLRAAVELVETDDWRAALPVGWQPTGEPGRAVITELVRRLAAAVATVDPAAVGLAMHDRRAGLQRPEPVRPVAQALAAQSLGAHDPVRLRAHLGARLTGDPGSGDGLLVLPGRRLPVAAAEMAAVRSMLDGQPATAAGLPGLDPAAAVSLVRRLLRDGVLVPLDGSTGTTDASGAADPDGPDVGPPG